MDVECPYGCVRQDTVTTHDCPIGKAIDDQLATDREWFEAHPDAAYYWRDLLPGDVELSNLDPVFAVDDKPMKVCVRKTAHDGLRVRSLPENVAVIVAGPDASPESQHLAFRIAQIAKADPIDPSKHAELTQPKVPLSIESPAERSFWLAWVAVAPEHNLACQVRIGKYRADFAIPEKKVAIEIDGLQHHSGQAKFVADQKRQRFIQKQGWTVLRFAAKEALNDPTRCVRDVLNFIQ